MGDLSEPRRATSASAALIDVNGFEQCDLTRPDTVAVSKVEANGKVRICHSRIDSDEKERS